MAQETFDKLLDGDWELVFEDSGTQNWQDNWFVDGERADIRNTPEGMVFSAGPVAYDNGSHSVLWTRESFAGNIRIEFDFTRLDTITRFVNILYIQATGIGEEPYTEDIAEWADLRQVPFMSSYFNNMNLLHISYAAFGNQDDKDEDYVRARRYPARPDRPFGETDLSPDNFETGLFRPGKTYHICAIKTDDHLFFDVQGEEQGDLFHWPLNDVEPIDHGRVGIRHMWTRCSRYANVQVWTEEN
ncbi:MAG: DUF1961 family protein [Candidatus Brocadiia bacterium]